MSVTTDKNYDSEFCGSIPLNFINQIQPHGILLVLHKPDLNIVQVSENIKAFFELTAEHFVKKSLASFVDASTLEAIQGKIEQWSLTDKIPFQLHITAQDKTVLFDAILHHKPEYVILELEEVKTVSPTNTFLRIYQETKYIMAALKDADSMQALTSIAVEEIKRLSGFDRVMLYKFDEQWNGTVIAEAREQDMIAYLHLCFPASDVPKQARELYFRTPYRIIPEVNFKPAILFPVVNPITYNFTDLSECVLRSVPQVHVEYLNNMEVGASMSTPIIKDNKLWGLISCHHKTPKYLNVEMRSAFELLSNIISAQLLAKEKEQTLTQISRLKDIYSSMIAGMFTMDDFRNGFFGTNPDLLDLLNLSGAVIALDGEFFSKGFVPELHDVKELIRWLQRHNKETVFATHELPKHFERFAANKETASGLMAVPISTKRGDFILGFRGEILTTIKWGGDPNQAIQFEPNSKNYHPRNSFAVWQETVRNTSLPWTQQELEIAEKLRTAVIEFILAEKY